MEKRLAQFGGKTADSAWLRMPPLDVSGTLSLTEGRKPRQDPLATRAVRLATPPLGPTQARNHRGSESPPWRCPSISAFSSG